MNNIERTKIIDVPVDIVSLNQATELIGQIISDKKKLHVITVNAEMVMLTKEDQEFFFNF